MAISQDLESQKMGPNPVAHDLFVNTNKIIENFTPNTKTRCTMVTVFGSAKTVAQR